MATVNLAPEFNRVARAEADEYLDPFSDFLTERFGVATTEAVLQVLDNLNLPRPQTQNEYLRAYAGCLLFLNRQGIVIRIEDADAERINDSPWVLQPIASIRAREAIIEICPGCDSVSDVRTVDYVYVHARHNRIYYEDAKPDNTGRIRIKMPHFPDGVPVVIDRLAVEKLCADAKVFRDALDDVLDAEASKAQELLYAPLQRAFQGAYGVPEKMLSFWDLCAKHTGEGKLSTSWKTSLIGDKKRDAAIASDAYSERVNKFLKRSDASEAPQSTLPQVWTTVG